MFRCFHFDRSITVLSLLPTCAVFAWIFHSWALLVVTPMYVYMVWGLEDAGFIKEHLEESETHRTAPSVPSGREAAPVGGLEQDSIKRH